MSTTETKTAKKPAASKKKATAPLSVLDGSVPAPEVDAAAAPNVVEAAQSVILGPVMRKKELVDAVVERSGMKKKNVKPVVESMLEVLGEALAEKRELNLQPLGRVKIRREKTFQNGRVLVTKIRQTTGPAPDKTKAAE